MRYLEESRTRWQKTVEVASTLSNLKSAVKSQEDSPCIIGLRSVCWKVFLLFHTTSPSNWTAILGDSRNAYSSLRGHLLRYLDHPNELGSDSDPLDDDKDSPWNVLRQDEELRAEIMQDVERCMPEEAFFRQSETQRILLDVLFVFCKMNVDVGYRQGMHELLAPILWVLKQDAVRINDEGDLGMDKDVMMTTLDADFIEHDGFTLFSLLMQSAKSFYELDGSNGQNSTTLIVARSKLIHEVYLATLDPELADHLTTIQVLPQIFLIRWVRLLFGREFPFDSLLCLWDFLFAVDPGLGLIDMICVAMILRIRWQLMEADTSTALTLLLAYPNPKPPHGPQTFVEDAIYLRENLNSAAGLKIVAAYSGRSLPSYHSTMPPATPSAGNLVSMRKLISPLPAPSRFLQNQGGVEALLQGAAKGVFNRSERLGINKVVRDAVGEVKKNMQNLQSPNPSTSRKSSDIVRGSLEECHPMPTCLTEMEQRNSQLGQMLGSILGELRSISSSQDPVPATSKTFGGAIAKLELVQLCLEDPSMPLPLPPTEDHMAARTKADVASSQANTQSPTQDVERNNSTTGAEPSKRVELSHHLPSAISSYNPTIPTRPRALIPTRSTLAQSSFAFMLEPDHSSTTSNTTPSFPKITPVFRAAGSKPTAGSSREKAFLFGDEPEAAEEVPRQSSLQHGAGEEFNMGTIGGGGDGNG